jgi:AraC family transcriptional regulator of arabinose operon
VLDLAYGEAAEVVLDPGSVLVRGQPHVQLVLLLTGSFAVSLDAGPARTALAPCAFHLLPGHEERLETAPDVPTRHWYVHAAVPRLAPSMRTRLEALPWPQPLSAGLLDLVRLAAHPGAPGQDMSEHRRALVTGCLWRYLLDGEQAVRPLPDPVLRVVAYVAGALDAPADLARLAAVGGVSREQLIRLFRASLGTTPMAYVWSRRLRAALDLIVTTALPIEAVARRTGFASAQHLSRKVRAATGASPGAVRSRGTWHPLPDEGTPAVRPMAPEPDADQVALHVLTDGPRHGRESTRDRRSG